jgi:hypothetical protein
MKMVAYAKRSLSGEMGRGEYGPDFPLAQFKMPDGRVLKQFVQLVRSCGGSCFFLALKDSRGCTVRKSKWTDAEIDKCLGIGQDEAQDSGVTEEEWLKSQREENMKAVIEIYWDPHGTSGGKPGCWRARLQKMTSCHAADRTKGGAIDDLLRTAKSFGFSGEHEDYEVIDRPNWPYKAGDVEAPLLLHPFYPPLPPSN